MGCCGPSHNKKKLDMHAPDNNLSAIDLLKIRLARGEISIEEYLKTKEVLEQ